jgi:hypothetical protein
VAGIQRCVLPLLADCGGTLSENSRTQRDVAVRMLRAAKKLPVSIRVPHADYMGERLPEADYDEYDDCQACSKRRCNNTH